MQDKKYFETVFTVGTGMLGCSAFKVNHKSGAKRLVPLLFGDYAYKVELSELPDEEFTAKHKTLWVKTEDIPAYFPIYTFNPEYDEDLKYIERLEYVMGATMLSLETIIRPYELFSYGLTYEFSHYNLFAEDERFSFTVNHKEGLEPLVKALVATGSKIMAYEEGVGKPQGEFGRMFGKKTFTVKLASGERVFSTTHENVAVRIFDNLRILGIESQVVIGIK